MSIIIISPGLALGPDRPRAHAGERGQRAREGAEDELLGDQLSIIIISPGLDSRARTALEPHAGEHGQRASEGAEDELLGDQPSNASDQADSGCLSPLVSMGAVHRLAAVRLLSP